VSYVRTAYMRDRGGPTIPKDDYRLDYLAGLSGIDLKSPTMRMPDRVPRFIWRGSAANLQADAESVRGKAHAWISQFRQALIDQGVVTAEEAQAGPNSRSK
jgi:hypothetical protein